VRAAADLVRRGESMSEGFDIYRILGIEVHCKWTNSTSRRAATVGVEPVFEIRLVSMHDGRRR